MKGCLGWLDADDDLELSVGETNGILIDTGEPLRGTTANRWISAQRSSSQYACTDVVTNEPLGINLHSIVSGRVATAVSSVAVWAMLDAGLDEQASSDAACYALVPHTPCDTSSQYASEYGCNGDVAYSCVHRGERLSVFNYEATAMFLRDGQNDATTLAWIVAQESVADAVELGAGVLKCASAETADAGCATVGNLTLAALHNSAMRALAGMAVAGRHVDMAQASNVTAYLDALLARHPGVAPVDRAAAEAAIVAAAATTRVTLGL